MDVHNRATRSKNMAAIKSRNTRPEVKLRKALFKVGLRYRVNYNLPGKPDIAFPRKKLVVFVDGCFWHCCSKCYCEPDNNKEFWQKKITSNITRDNEVNKILNETGWTVLRFWEHEIKKDIDGVTAIIINKVKPELISQLNYEIELIDKSLVAEETAVYKKKS
jgi:DNA mismatch endonuclease (patch repair protein)